MHHGQNLQQARHGQHANSHLFRLTSLTSTTPSLPLHSASQSSAVSFSTERMCAAAGGMPWQQLFNGMPNGAEASRGARDSGLYQAHTGPASTSETKAQLLRNLLGIKAPSPAAQACPAAACTG